MQTAPKRKNEPASLAALRALDVLDTGPEAEFDALVQVASLVCGTPISLFSLIDAERQWFKANVGLRGVTETSRDAAFCAHAVLAEEVFEIPDATQDDRFADNPLVAGPPDIRFYAGAPVRLRDGTCVGTLCVIDRKPRLLDEQQREVLRQLARVAARALENRHTARMQHRATLAEARAAIDLAASESRFRALSDTSPLGVYYAEPDGKCTYTNERWQEIYGLSLAQSLGHGWANTLHPEDQNAVFAEWQRSAAAHTEFNMEFRILRPDGTIRYVHSRARAVTGEGGSIVGFVGSVADETERVANIQALKKANERVALANDSGGIGIWEWNPSSDVLVLDAQTYRLYGFAPRDGTGAYETWRQRVHPDDLAATEETIRAAREARKSFDTGFRVIWPDGQVRHLRMAGRVDCDEKGRELLLTGVNWDVTEAAQLTAELAMQHEMLRVTLTSIGDAVITTDAQGRIDWLNPVAEKMTGWRLDEAKGCPLAQVFRIIHQDTRAPTESPVATCLANGEVVGLADHTVLVSRDGTELAIADSAAPIRNTAGDVLGAVLVFHDVSEQRRLSGEMTYRATHDALTGLVNRVEFEARLASVLRKAHEDRTEHALLYIDLDQFKIVNDTCGHAIGDQLLQQVGRLLAETVRGRDTLARLGGDEFGIILEHCTADQAHKVAQKICDRMDDFRFNHGERRFRIGTSIGLVPVDRRWTTTSAMQQAADTSCYAAKEAGRNRVHAWFDTDVAMRTRQVETQWTARIEQALDENQFVLFAQRIETLGDKPHKMHAEVLLRLVNDDRSFTLPGAFLPAAERFHLISRIDRWVLKAACEWMRAAPSLDEIDSLSINLSGQSIGDRAFHGWANELFATVGPLIRSKLCLEITETTAVTNLADAAIFIDQVRAAGIKVALDDFGSGASSFGYLKTLSVDYLKIDGQFIHDMINNPLNEAAVRCFADVAKVMGLKTVAEFVGEPAVRERLRDMGIDYGQGFLYHRPAPIDALSSARAAVFH